MARVSTARGRRSKARLDRRTRDARRQGRDAREALLKAALRVFARRGFQRSSIDEIARGAGFSKGAVYWHFSGKEDLFFALLEERLDRPTREMIELLRSAPAEQDMAKEASQRFAALFLRERELFLVEQEYWSLAVRDARLRARYARRQADLRAALAGALRARVRHLGTPRLAARADEVATAIMALASGLALQKLIEPRAVPDHLLGDTIASIYAGQIARAQEPDASPTRRRPHRAGRR